MLYLHGSANALNLRPHHIKNIRVAETDDVNHFRQIRVMDVSENLVEDYLPTDYDHDEAQLELDPLFGVQIEDKYEA
ncbi:uncharacterized protein PADG_11942 [Paracoccidioides brasiliensis Pb18]|uniref:Uncharacterized protein n=1 Tax=Paracoccidioides brasiliensis (strain Pb18) TaxID=502780 RepID=A0A0A0HRX2_PARBD|nr:uncharacterized protein PADG_11942 [Paracoccidioides brasiliensis Pb18]KGM91964.1 hypothetical protein PADG_11942 [Paracoccidioides brasiliensis Pb18]ODH45891.1 hypothetical protein GX48_08026 [Paracoccidioides brasiliensis]